MQNQCNSYFNDDSDLFKLFFRLQLTCDNSIYGCTAILKLDLLQTHVQECEFNPKRPVPCELGCGLVVPKDELKGIYLQINHLRCRKVNNTHLLQEHNCVRELRSLMQAQQSKLVEVQAEVAEGKFQLQEQKA